MEGTPKVTTNSAPQRPASTKRVIARLVLNVSQRHASERGRGAGVAPRGRRNADTPTSFFLGILGSSESAIQRRPAAVPGTRRAAQHPTTERSSATHSRYMIPHSPLHPVCRHGPTLHRPRPPKGSQRRHGPAARGTTVTRITTSGAAGRGLHSTTSQLNLCRFWHKTHCQHRLMPPTTS